VAIAERQEREKVFQQKMRRKQILDAAKRLFYEKVFSATTIEDIAQEAELSPAALYLYFQNKRDLYASSNLQLLEYLAERVEDLYAEKNLNAQGKLQALKDLLYEVFDFDPLILINLFLLQARRSQKFVFQAYRPAQRIGYEMPRKLGQHLRKGHERRSLYGVQVLRPCRYHLDYFYRVRSVGKNQSNDNSQERLS